MYTESCCTFCRKSFCIIFGVHVEFLHKTQNTFVSEMMLDREKIDLMFHPQGKSRFPNFSFIYKLWSKLREQMHSGILQWGVTTSGSMSLATGFIAKSYCIFVIATHVIAFPISALHMNCWTSYGVKYTQRYFSYQSLQGLASLLATRFIAYSYCIFVIANHVMSFTNFSITT